ncbi:MAG: SWIM zinc finger family protein, partial [Anaerolineales bacterium]|nr:SWIM zinc finger family protein [Anaerolineales bacterium]
RAKEAAKLAAIKTVNPALFRMARAVIEHHGDRVASRAWSACDLVLAGDVEAGEGGAMVRSQSNAFARYQVTMAGRSCSCSCLDMGITLSNGTPVCKHILATVFQLNLARQAEQEPAY